MTSSEDMVTIAELRRKNRNLVRAAKALVDRWNTPLWKNTRHTGDYIKALSEAVEDSEKGMK